MLSVDLDEAKYEDKGHYKQMTDALLALSSAKLSGKSVTYARSLAEKKLADGRDKERIRRIVECLNESLVSPSDTVIAAIADVILDWKGLDPVPQPEDAITAWHRRRDSATTQTVKSVEIQAKQSINGLLRLTVAKVCAIRGWDCLVQAKVKGLRYRYEGGNGYHAVSQTDGVPADLHVGGLSTGDAKKVIQQLELLLKQ